MQKHTWINRPECHHAYLQLDLPPQANVIYRSNNNMNAVEQGTPFFSANGFDGDYQSQDVVVVGDWASKKFVLVGAVTAFRSMTYFLVERRSRLLGIQMTQPNIRPGEKPEEIIVLEGDDWRQLLRDYAEIAAKKMGVKPFDTAKNLTGYCTWYYYYADVTEADFLENVRALKATRDGVYSAQIVQIDDGYQTFQGDWLDQDQSWPTPLKQIASEISDGDMVPGIWLMPMVASTASRTFREHPEWFVQNEANEPLVFLGWSPAPDHLWACLDATRADVREHLTSVFQKMWADGYRYFKMDGLGFGLPQGKFSDPNATPVSAFRLALSTIRQAVPEATLLGCCPPFMACLGLVDMCRVSGDTSRYWSAIQTTFRISLSNWWMFDRWFRADPDVLMTRADNAFYTIGEARISALGGILTGVALTSDHLGKITEERLALLGRAAKLRLRNLEPHWEPGAWPTWFGGTIDDRKAAAFVNDGEEEREFDFAALGLPLQGVECLANEAKPVAEKLKLAPHDAAVVVFA